MMNVVEVYFCFFFFISIMKMMMSEKIIFILMSMEMMMMSIYFFFFMFYKDWFTSSILNIIFLSFMVCESVLGLGAYIYLSRLSGKDEFKSLNLLK
uniref:NADH-ubiquinone oxidoreductase chain 4L n=1 Tax=Colpocephalum griffoneae TaxID=2358484 RepID=A0A386B2Q5_9NEOP|nr:NADH dehydrogenase subunit 4L [Colpocephalum griffoneae]AYC65894.1 NADH dehydrogenase subunit 4L [Colpocephalum griffoneae]